MGSVQRFSLSNDDFPRALGKVSFVGYFILLFFFVAFDVHIGDEPTRIDMASSGGAAVAALLWFGIGLLVEGSYRYWRGSFEARGIALGGAVAAGIGVLILLFVEKGGLLSWVGGGLALLVCIVLGAIQKGVTLTGAFGRLALLAAAYGLLAIIGPRNDVNHKPSPEAIQQARKAFSYE